MTTKAAANVYRGYVPIGLPQNRKPNPVKPWFKVIGKPKLTIYPPPEVEEWAETAEYPELFDGTQSNAKRQYRLGWYDQLKAIPTADEKMYEIAKQTRIFTGTVKNFWLPVYNSLPLAQYMTHTHLVEKLPDKYQQTVDGSLVEQVTEMLLDKFNCHHHTYTRAPAYLPDSMKMFDRNYFKDYELLQDLVSGARRMLIHDSPFMLDSQIDLEPTVNTWWWHSGFPPPNKKIWWKSRKDDDGYVTTSLQLRGKTALNIRNDSMLSPILAQDDPLVTDKEFIPKRPVLLNEFGAKFRFTHPVVMPGFKYEDEPRYDCPHTSFLTTNCLTYRNNDSIMPLNDTENCLNAQAVLAAFSWLNSLASYHGFTVFQELTYPLTCQTVTTNGQDWMFHVFQLNAHSFHRDFGPVKKNNICWSSGLIKLFGSQENGKFVDIDQEVARLLIQFLTNEPSGLQENLRPYLGQDTRDDETRKSTQADLQKLFENRYRVWHDNLNRVPLWEHIFIRSPEARYSLPHIKPKHKVGWPTQHPKVFE